MTMIYPKSPKRTDKVLNFDAYNFLFSQVKKLLGLRFDDKKFRVQHDSAGMYVTLKAGAGGSADNPSSWAFGCTLSSTTTGEGESAVTTYKVHVEEGDVFIQGKTITTVSASDYDLPSQGSSSDGDYAFPVVKMQLSDTSTATIEIVSEYPTMSTSEIIVPLMWYEFSKDESADPPDKGSWGNRSILHRGNIQMMSMLVTG